MLEQHLVALLLKVAVAASLASVLGRSGAFIRMLLREERTIPQRVKFALSLALIFGAGVAARVLTRNAYQAVDLGLEGAILAGVLGGYLTGLVGGVLISLPAVMNGEYVTMLVLGGAGVAGGLLRDLAPNPDAVWSFSPYFDLNLYRFFRRKYDPRVTTFHLLFLTGVLFSEFLRMNMDVAMEPQLVWTIYENWNSEARSSSDWVGVAMIYTTTVFAVSIPLKIWSSIRNEKLLEAQQRLLTEARLRALTSQINPHFLFNTLNTVTSLIRTNPDKARGVVVKLSNILRRLLRKTESLTTLREELAFIDDYLSIEMTRFGDKLRFVRQTEEETLDCLVPSMLLQPIIENSIKHGLSRKVEGGTITLTATLDGPRMKIAIEDDGEGVQEEKLAHLFESGIGVSNVNERLKVLFGEDYKMEIISEAGQGTRTELEFPLPTRTQESEPAPASVSGPGAGGNSSGSRATA